MSVAAAVVGGGAILAIFAIYGGSEPSVPSNADASVSPSSVPSASAQPVACEDATAAFRASGGSELVQRVCWEPTGQLRAEAGFAVDAEPGSAPMRAVCTALSDFVGGSGKEWKGFTVYSTHRLSPGQAVLTSRQQGQCVRP